MNGGENSRPAQPRDPAAREPGPCARVRKTDVKDWLDDAILEIRSYMDLPDDWDSYGGGPVGRETVDAAVQFAEIMAGRGFSRPDICPESCGGILFEWQLADRVLTVDFPENGKTSFSYEVYGGDEVEGDLRRLFALVRSDSLAFQGQ